ncbi:uncharacterized protein Triagg1_277 [Trichoderma aggressivum f. europaeum]|uniref:Ankyrin repeat protein n=1 Tax=Trichoderma aggressivum f. europaeum TaxID=173218 RepID=A0AAE1IK32_9HYPO|nr:hypothetical protein Triagg1_277 [Trichoderma aggressivum f. europaeum]
MQIRSPQHLTSNIDIVDRAASFGHPENHTRGALVSIDLNCPADFFFGRKDLVAKFSLCFTTQIQGGFHKPIAIQHAEVGYFRTDNNITKLVQDVEKLPLLKISGAFNKNEADKKGEADNEADIEIHQSNDSGSDDSCSIRIVALLDAYPSNMEVAASLSTYTSSTAEGHIRHSRTFTSSTDSRVAPFPNEERLQKLLCWTAALGYEKLFEAYLDQGPSMLDMEDEFGMTPLSCAAFAGQISVIQLALQEGGCDRARKKTARGHSPLEAAACRDDACTFESFLKLLKYFKGLGSATPPAQIPKPGAMPGLEDGDIQNELDSAAIGEQTATVRKLVGMLLTRQNDQESWLAHQMLQAASRGALCLVQVLKSFGAKVKAGIDVEVDGEVGHKTPLMSAIEANKTKVAEFLIIHGAGNEDALRVAVCNKQHSIIQALLQAGILVKGELKTELLNIATTQKDSTTLMLLELEKGTGKLATSADLDPDVDKHFEATVVTFLEEKTPDFKELSVADLMGRGENFFSLNNESITDSFGKKLKIKFKWFHLPANNMKWVEDNKALFGNIYHDDPSLAYKVLEPKRWVKRQHEGERGSPHARFMIPACHDFSEAFKDKKSEITDTIMRKQMPYLHWDEEDAMQKRSKYIAESSSGGTTSYRRVWNESSAPLGKLEKEKMLLSKYLLSEDDYNPNFRHVLHIRRTLDQYLYHNLKDTIIRDADQTVHRYQKKLNRDKGSEKEDPFTAIMVDQLWLWILVDQSGKAKAMVTCFPSRDWVDVGVKASAPNQMKSILDRTRTTDVLQSTRSYIQQRPDAVKTPYDLAGVIASRCSRALLDHSTDMLNFAEVYENSISDITANHFNIIVVQMNEETLLFNRFNSLMQTRTKILDGFRDMMKSNRLSKKDDSYRSSADKIMDNIQWLLQQDQIPEDSVELCDKYRKYTLESEIPTIDEIKILETRASEQKQNNLETKEGKEKWKDDLKKLLEKFGRFYVLDITREITLLSQIKDIQDELEMMQKVFAEQDEALKAMDRIIRTMEQRDSDSNDNMQPATFDAKLHYRRGSRSRKMQEYDPEEIQDRFGDYNYSSSIDTLPMAAHALASGSDFQKLSYSSQSIIWGLGHQEHNLPLRTVSRHSNQIKKMLKRAKTTNEAEEY